MQNYLLQNSIDCKQSGPHIDAVVPQSLGKQSDYKLYIFITLILVSVLLYFIINSKTSSKKRKKKSPSSVVI